MEPLLVMSGEAMGVRIGSAGSGNVMNLGQMGSGTSWQPGHVADEHDG